ncbi:MAG: M48 family metalloprotease [Simkaniaceae bacterium]|nr:M48 family metalloprotease [Simkaniaceae bacterium]
MSISLRPKDLYVHARNNAINLDDRNVCYTAKKATTCCGKTLSVIAPRNEVTGSRSCRFLPKCFEKVIGSLMYPSLINQFGGISFDRDKSAIINRVKAKLLPKVRRKFNWDIVLTESSVVNACALPGGKIIITTGILDAMAKYLLLKYEEAYEGDGDKGCAYMTQNFARSIHSQAELKRFLTRDLENMVAAVLGHEIAHADIGHGRDALQYTILLQILLLIGYFMIFLIFAGQKQKAARERGPNGAERINKLNGMQKIINWVYGIFTQIAIKLVMLFNSRKNEYEADKVGMRAYTHEAGYDLRCAALVYDMFERKSGDSHAMDGCLRKMKECCATHPISHKRRARALEISKELTGHTGHIH